MSQSDAGPTSVPSAVVLDASVWVSHQIPTDANHPVARGWIARHLRAGGTLVQPEWFWAEVAAAVARQSGPAAATEQLALLARLQRAGVMQRVPWTAALFADTVDVAVNHRLRAGDALYVALAHRLAVPLVSFDRDHLTRGSAVVRVIRP